MSHRLIIAAAATLLIPCPAALAQPGPLDLVPANAAAAVVIRNLDELKTKGDTFLKEADIQVSLRPSELFAMAYRELGIQGGVDNAGAGAIVLAAPDDKDENIGLGNLERLLVGVLPFTDRDKMAANFGFKPGELKPNKVVAIERKNFGQFVYVRGKHLFLGNDAKVLERVATARSVAAELPESRRKTLNAADIMVVIGPRSFGKDWARIQQELRDSLTKNVDEAERKLVEQLVDSLGGARFGVAALRIDRGIGASFAVVFPEKGHEASAKFLAALGGAPGPSHLTALPEGRVVAAQATSGDGTRTALIARILLNFLAENFLETKVLLSAADRPTYVGVLGEIWQQLRGSRAALYQTADEHKLGLFSLVAILDTEDAGQFLGVMRLLAGIADDSAPNVKENRAAIDVAKLVQDLGDVRFRVRESATVKLRLIGEPALAELKKASESIDLEVSRRAERLWRQIERSAAVRRKELLAQDLPHALRPTFAFAKRTETRVGYAVEVVRVKLAGKDAIRAAQLRQLLGPEWDRVRLAVHGKHVVVLVGSDVELLDKALDNLKQGKAGLAGAKTLAGFQRQANAARTIEFHFDVASWLALVTPPGDDPRLTAAPTRALTSFGLTAQGNALQLDIWIPAAEVRVLAKRDRWW